MSSGEGRSGRDVAVDVLLRVERGGAYCAPTLEAELDRSGLDVRDRALVTELVFGVLRWRGALDTRLEGVVSRALSGLDATVLACLRLGAYQLLGELRVPAHAAVSESVRIAKARRGRGPAGLVNAVLRKISDQPGPPLDPLDAMPGWLARRIESSHVREELLALARATVEQPWTGLRLEVSSGLSREELAAELRAEVPGATIELGQLSPWALRTRGLGRITQTSAYERGHLSIQDEGAQACALLCDVSPGHRVLDACAGRGGKTSFLASQVEGRASIDAADRHPRKLAQLEAELGRLGLGGVRTVAVDLERGTAGLEPPYDRILLDVPCSGTGTLSRRPEIKWRLMPADVDRLATSQARLLDRCLGMLAHGGVLVYCSCSLLPEEGEEQVAGAIERCSLLSLDRELRLWPHRHGTDGFYAARLVAS